jgi:hypothetical protein
MSGTVPQIPGTPDARALFGSTFFHALAPGQWKASPTQDGVPRGVTGDFSTADPPFETGRADRYSNAPGLAKAVFGIGLREVTRQFGVLWVMTDYATARRLGLTPVSIQFQPGGDFVTPTPQTIAAGAASLTRQPDRTLAPDPAKLAPGAYPLTMVEYALAPSEALPKERCAEAPLLASWLHYVAGDGQKVLADGDTGLVPLTPALAAEAKTAADSVAAVPQPNCAPAGPPPPPGGGPVPPGGTGTPPAGFGGPAGGFDTGAGFGGDGSGSGLGSTAAPVAPTASSRRAAARAVAAAAIHTPPFLGIRKLSTVAPPLALLLVVVLTSGAALATSGRPVPAVLIGTPRRIAGRLRPSGGRRAGPAAAGPD